MIVLSHGVLKSGSTFAFQLTRDILYASGQNQYELKRKYLPSYRWADRRGVESAHNLVTPTNTSLSEISDAIPSGCWLILKTHEGPTAEAVRMLGTGEMRVTSTYRPADEVEAALRRMAEIELKDPTVLQRFVENIDPTAAYQRADNSTYGGREWQAVEGVISIHFRELIATPRDVARRIAVILHADAVNTDGIVAYYEDDKTRIQEYSRRDITPLRRVPMAFYPQWGFPEGYWVENLMHATGLATSETIIREARVRLRAFGYTDRQLDDMQDAARKSWGLAEANR